MAIASVGTLGTGASGTSSNSFTITTTAALEAGNTGIVAVSSDNTSTGADGDGGEITSVTDSAGNTWVKLGEYGNNNGSAAAGAVAAVWMTRAQFTLASSGTITINFVSNRTDKCACAWEFTTAGGGLILVSGPVTPDAVDASNGFGSVSISGLSSLSRLYFRGLSKEANTTTDITPSTSFTAISPTRSRNNAAAVIVRGEFRINTSTGETSNPTLAVSGDTAGVFVALEERGGAFPFTPQYYDHLMVR